MPTALDSQIFGPLFIDSEVAQLFTDEAYIRALVAVEAALARAEARLGVIPQGAAEQISSVAEANRIDIGALSRGTLRSGFPIIALVEEIRKAVGEEVAPYVHWGATTQDIMDTACMLQIHAAGSLLDDRLGELARQLGELADRHRAVVVAARTHGQQALPTSLGLKIANWLAPMVRHRERLAEISLRVLAVQFGGAAGTLAALGDKGLAVMKALAEELHLSAPAAPWHAQRDNLVEFAGWLSLVTGSLGKMAQDIILLAQTEVGELAESGEAGRGSSSTMPQKSNPITSELIVAAARMNASLLSAMHHALIQEQERGTHGWQVEWLTLPQMILLTGGALRHGLYLAKNLQIDEAKMHENIARANDVVLAEAAVFALARSVPRAKAEALVKKACHMAGAGKPLIDVVRELANSEAPDATVDWAALAETKNYLGESDRIIDAVLARAKNFAQS